MTVIVTVTPNPSVDRTVTVSRLRLGEVQRAVSSREDAGGKGVNVSRALALHGIRTTAVLPVGGTAGDRLLDLLDGTGVDVRPVRVAGATRSNLTLAEADGTTTKINEPGSRMGPDEAGALDVTIDALLPGATWVVGSGSVPPGLGDDVFARLVARAQAAGVPVAIDTSGAPLRHALAARPSLVAPNRAELADALGRPLRTMGEVVDAARGLVDDGIARVLITLGAQGAVLVTREGAWHADSAAGTAVSTVGAGDALLAGFLAAASEGADDLACLARGVAFGAAAVALPGSTMPNPVQTGAIVARSDSKPHPDMLLTD